MAAPMLATGTASPRDGDHLVARELLVVGPTLVTNDGAATSLRPRERDVLTVLAMAPDRSTSLDSIIDTIWPRDPPHTARQAVHNHVSRLRRTMGADAIVTEAGPAYRLGPGWRVDAEEFDQRLALARRATADGNHAAVRSHLRRALALRRGDLFQELPDADGVVARRVGFANACLAAEDDIVLTLLSEGAFDVAVPEASTLAEAEPFREARWMMLALAQYRCGQRRASVEALQRARSELRESAGLDVGPHLVRLESLLLDDDATLVTTEPAVLIGADRRRRVRATAWGGPFIGRAAPLDDLHRHLTDRPEAGPAVWIDVSGDAGIGVSEFLRRAATRARLEGWSTVEVSPGRGTARAIEPFGDIVRQIIDMTPDPIESFGAGLLAAVRPLHTDGDVDHPWIEPGTAAIDMIERCADHRPTVVLIDDADRLSVTSRTLVARLASSSSRLTVVTARADSAPAVGSTARTPDVAVHLRGLDVIETRDLLQALTGDEIDLATARAAHATSSGNPAALRRLSGAVADTPAELGVCDLGEAQRAIVAVLAVAGRPTERAVVVACLPDLDEPAADAIATALAEGVVRAVADDLLEPASASLARAVLAEVDADARTALHARLGSAMLELGVGALAAAPHLLASADLDPEGCIACVAAAAQVAQRSTMYAEAADLLERGETLAADVWGRDDRRTSELALARASNLRAAGDPGCADVVWEVVRAADATGDDSLLARAAAELCKLGPHTESGKLVVPVAGVVERAIEQCTDAALRAACAGQATLFYSMSGEIARCRSYFDVALDEARQSDDPHTLLAALGNAYASLVHPVDWPLRSTLAAEMLAIAEQVDDDDARFEALHLYFSTQVQFADPLLRTTFERQRSLGVSLRSAGRRWMAGYQDACLAYLDGRLDDSDALSTTWFERAPVAPSRALSTHFMNVIVVRLAQGRVDELARETDAIATEQAELPGWRAVAAWIAARRGDHDRVIHECDALDTGAGLPHDMSWSGATMWLGRAVAAAGDADRSRAITELIAPYTGWMTWYGSGTVGPFDLALAELALTAGDRGSAAHHLAVARSVVGRLGARVYEPDLDRLAARLAG